MVRIFGEQRSVTASLAGIEMRQIAVITWLAIGRCLLAQAPGYTISSLTGSAANQATVGLAVDASGNLYSANLSNMILKVSTTGTVTTVAGGGPANSSGLVGDNGPATNAILSYPSGVAVDASGNVYIADTGHNRIRMVSTSGTITTVAGPGSSNGTLGDGGPAAGATLSVPAGLALDSLGNIYIADTGHNRVRKVSLDGTIDTVAGNGSASGALGDGGQAAKATVSQPTGIAVDASGDLYIADSGNKRIRMVSPAGIIRTVAGNGTFAYAGDGGLATLAAIGGVEEAEFTYWYFPQGLALDGSGNLYISDTANRRLRVLTLDGKINTIAGDGGATSTGDNGPATSAGIPTICSVALGNGGEVYVTDGNTVRVLTPTGKPVYPGPSYEAGGVVGASAFGATSQLALGSWVEIHGSYLAPDSRSWTGADFSGVNAPIALDGTSVTIGGQPAFVSYISPGQINAQVPTNIGSGSQQTIVTTTYGKTVAYVATVNGVLPRLLAPSSFDIGSVQYAVALFPDNATYVLPSGAIAGVPSRPAKTGDTITLYGIGFGSVTPNSPAGQIIEAGNSLVLPFTVNIGSATATTQYAGLAPGTVGLFQFNVVVPKLSYTGAVPLSFTLGGVAGAQQLYISTQ
jgi:uncharacterized protein (TIGR03437 family)